MAGARQIARILLERGAVLLRPSEPFRFASGILSPIYCDNRLLLSDPERRKIVVAGLSDLVEAFKPDVVAGTATAGIPWGAWIADRVGKPFVYVRAEAKAHGKGKRVEGQFPKGSRTVVVEDLISTGGSSLSAAEAIRDEGGKVAGVVAIFTYGFAEATNAFRQQRLPLRALVDLDDLLEEALESGNVSAGDRSAVRAWRDDPKNWKAGYFTSPL